MLSAPLAALKESGVSIAIVIISSLNQCYHGCQSQLYTRPQQGCCPAVLLLLLEAVSNLPTCLVQLAVTLPRD
jgi:hypothetical protein